MSKNEQIFIAETKTFSKADSSSLKIFAQIGMDLIHMNRCRGYNYIITAVDYLSKYCEMRALKEKVQKKLQGSYMKI